MTSQPASFEIFGCKCVCMYVCLTHFLKINLTKFAVIWVEKRQKAHFLRPRSSKIRVTNEKERRKRKSEEKERRRRKKAMLALLDFIIATLEIVFGRRKLLNAKDLFGDNVIKNPARYRSPHLPRFQVRPSKSRLFRSLSIDSERKQKNSQNTNKVWCGKL